MFTEQFVIYLTAMLLVFLINILGYTKLKALYFFGIIGTLLFAVPTIKAFDEDYIFAAFLIILNISLPLLGLTRTFGRD